VRSFASNALKQLGYTVLVAENGKIALDIITKNGHDLDLLVTDLIMPEMNGKELVNAVSSILPAMKVLYTSGYTDDHIVHSGALDEGIAFLSKPYSAQNLSRRIREILDEPA
jgi:CheY-like chemotaxis protein